ncbi:hypothetical protein [Paraburkholderia sp. J63]|uniref:hypothetical protein n=1 Tax=Paraburkholderia sp. J63 TaxID=2805434 RepID=UPI002ABDAC01|nr:hypothetical protein [Paraburkholderia sp. J63]
MKPKFARFVMPCGADMAAMWNAMDFRSVEPGCVFYAAIEVSDGRGNPLDRMLDWPTQISAPHTLFRFVHRPGINTLPVDPEIAPATTSSGKKFFYKTARFLPLFTRVFTTLTSNRRLEQKITHGARESPTTPREALPGGLPGCERFQRACARSVQTRHVRGQSGPRNGFPQYEIDGQ